MYLCAVCDKDGIICFSDGGVVVVVLMKEGERDVVACTDNDAVDIGEYGAGFQEDAEWEGGGGVV